MSHSAVVKKIKFRKQDPDLAARIAEANSTSPVAARILAARGYEPGKRLDDFLEPSLKHGLPNPEALRDLKAGVQLLQSVAASGKPIAICCDFDVDGLSGGSLLSRFLLDAGVPNKVFVPDRFTEGYGLNARIIADIIREEYGLLITVDFGSTNHSELTLAKTAGLPTLVIDHHHVEQHPPADVFINPKRKDCGFCDKVLSAAGLAWYFIAALRNALPGAANLDARSYLDLACLGTICDMVPLAGANRVIALRGLEQLQRTRRPGLIALKDISGVRQALTCTHVGFGIGPRLNAAGRMLNAEMVIGLLTTTDSRKSKKLADKLDRLNKQRQEMEIRIKQAAIDQVLKRGSPDWGIVAWDQAFHTGVIGIVAQRLVEEFFRPAAVIGKDVDAFKGSVRGIPGFNVVAALSELSSYLIKFGGHDGAGGFSIDESKIEGFYKAFNELCQERLQKIETNPTVWVDTSVKLSDLTADLVTELHKFSPFGIGNPAPVVGVKGLEVKDVQVLKNQHLKILLSDGKQHVQGFLWKQASHPKVTKGATVNIAARPELNSFNGVTSLQLNIQALE